MPEPAVHVARDRTVIGRLRLVGEVLWAYREVGEANEHDDVRDVIAHVRSSGSDGRTANISHARWLAHVVRRLLSATPLDDRCLRQSLVLSRLLSRRDIASSLVIGVRPGDDFGAHSWVEVGGHPVQPAGQGEFVRLVEL